MYAQYKPKQVVTIQFDLRQGKEIACAFTFFFGGLDKTPFTSPIKEQMETMLKALQEELVEKVEFDQECANFSICPKCGQEIDKRVQEHVFIENYYMHAKCPPLKPSDERDI